MRACDECLGRAWVLARVSGHLELTRGHIAEVLALGDKELIAAVGGRDAAAITRDRAQLDIGEQRRRCDAGGVATVCRCDPWYPESLRDLASPPAVLHVAGGADRLLGLASERPAAIVGSRRPSEYGREMAHSLARGVASAGLTVVSGMALGIDSAAHAGALAAAGGVTVAVLPGAVDRPYPASARRLHRQIVSRGVAISELPPGASVRRWMFPARNRIIAALSAMTVVVEAGEGSGALITARVAAALGRSLGAVPGRVTSQLTAGPHRLLTHGATLVAAPRDVLEELYGPDPPDVPRERERPPLERRLAALLGGLGDGRDAAEAFTVAGLSPGEGLAALSQLELDGYVRRAAGGRYTVLP
jgi:DNA processing protein